MGDQLKGFQSGSIIADRYQIIKSSLVLDTKPAKPPQLTQDIPEQVLPYLKLVPYQLHIPQIYGQATVEINHQRVNVWLLEYGLLRSDQETRFAKGKILPALNQVWAQAPPLRQINWLWQMAQLLPPLTKHKVASSLFKPSLLRVNGSVFQLLELRNDPTEMTMSVNLRQLGALWSQWVEGTSPAIQPWLAQLADQLIQGQLTQPDVLVAILDEALATCGQNQTRSYQVATRTDQGRTRHHNEDACHPPDGSVMKITNQDSLTIVCDGVGGHEGGEIASGLAIEAMKKGVQPVASESATLEPNQITEVLEDSTCAANDVISQRNDLEKRSDRQRMGTTLVMTFAHDHQMYLAHVGDSRVYWITRSGCYQVTLDDDLASREVRLGYTLYRDAVSYSGAGALVQALGMSSSKSLRPNVQRLVLDEDSVFLLCSDGLSDFDRVEQYWESTILPILNGQADVETVAEQLINLGNEKNGHDNITVALVYAQVQPKDSKQFPTLALPQLTNSAPSPQDAPTMVGAKTVQLSAPASPNPMRRFRGGLVFLITLLGLGAGFGISSYFFLPEEWERVSGWLGFVPQDSPEPSQVSTVSFSAGTQLELQNSLSLKRGNPTQPESLLPVAEIPSGSIIQVLGIETSTPQTPLLQVKLCALPKTEAGDEVSTLGDSGTEIQPQSPPSVGTQGWIQQNDSAIASARKLDVEDEFLKCPPASTDKAEGN
jgi:protein phosphatase